jgi:hypothetical protein
MSARQGWDSGALNHLLVEMGMVVMMVVVMVRYDHHNLRLRRIRCCEAEDESQSENDPFHNSVLRTAGCFTELL